MPENPTAPRPDRDRGGSSTTSTAEQSPKLDLTVNKVLAGAGAAATSAVLGSFLGAAGTVAGAALGSIASTVAATLYQHSLDRTRDTVVARIRLTGGRGVDVAEPAPDDDSTVVIPRVPADGDVSEAHVEPDVPRSRRRWGLLVGVTVLVFVIAMTAVWAIEAVKGSTLTRGESGTSVGRVFNPGPADAADDPETTAEPTTSAEPTDESTAPTTTTESESSTEPTEEGLAPGSPGDDSENDERGGTGAEPTGERGEPTEAPADQGTG